MLLLYIAAEVLHRSWHCDSQRGNTSMSLKACKILAAATGFLLLTAFGPGAPVRDVHASPIPANPAATMENVEKAILRAGLTLGWQMAPKGPGQIEGILLLRKHRAVVDITYDTEIFNIAYKDSTNLDYVDKDKTIHSNYNGWIQNLEKGIRAQVTVL